jgi:predicted DNA-binding transcriptional regulator YafY
MPSPTGRLLRVLELLQTEPLLTGPALAERLGVDRRTVRRDVATLKELGIPVEGERGVGGGYRLRPGYRLPPLMLTDDEAAAVVLGLAALGRLTPGEQHAESALRKLGRVLPERLRPRIEALEQAITFEAPTTGVPVAGATVLLVAEAVRRRRRLAVTYRDFHGVESQRELSPYGLVPRGGSWYLAAFDHLRGELRTFRADRIEQAVVAGPATAPPEGFEPAAHVERSLARVPWPWEVVVLLDLPLALASERVPPTLAELSEEGGGTLLRLRAASLDWAASFLAGLGCTFEIRRPAELRAAVTALAERLAASAG